MSNKTIIIFTVLAFALGGVFYLLYPTPDEYKSPNPSTDKEQVFCTQDTRACPDGSYVGRDPQNNCQFRPCPPPPPGTQIEDGTILDNRQ